MKRKDRFRAITDMIDERERVTVEELAAQFDVSPETVRRDLLAMSEQGLVRKVYGGAAKLQSAKEHSFLLRTHHYIDEKIAIARHAARFVQAGDSLFINAGTTTTVFARELVKQHYELTVITNCPHVAHELWNSGQSENKIYLLGGAYNGVEIETLGSTTVDAVREFHADHAFLTVGALNAMHGFMDYRVEAGDITRAMSKHARRVTVLIDSSKFDQMALVTACSLDAVERIVSNRTPSEQLASVLSNAGTSVHIAEHLR